MAEQYSKQDVRCAQNKDILWNIEKVSSKAQRYATGSTRSAADLPSRLTYLRPTSVMHRNLQERIHEVGRPLLDACQVPAMSMQLDGPAFALPEPVRRPKDKEIRGKDKKRKRTEEHSDQTSPTKKHRSKKSVDHPNPNGQELEVVAEQVWPSLETNGLSLLSVQDSPKKKHKSKSRRPVEDSEHMEVSPQPVESTGSSPFVTQTASFYLPLSPISLNDPLRGLLAEHISPLLLTFYPPLDGVVLSYSDPKLSSRPPEDPDSEEEEPALAQQIDEYAVSYIWLTATFLLFRPTRGCRIEGYINLQNEGNIGMVCYNFFSASIERRRLPKEWRWVRGGTGRIEARKARQSNGFEDGEEEEKDGGVLQVNGFGHDEGHFVDGRGRKVEGSLVFTVKSMEASRSTEREPTYVSIEGTMLSENEEKELREQDFERSEGRANGRLSGGKNLEYAMSGALTNGHVDSSSEMGPPPTPKMKHRMAY